MAPAHLVNPYIAHMDLNRRELLRRGAAAALGSLQPAAILERALAEPSRCGPPIRASNPISQRLRLEVHFKVSMKLAGTTSSHTVCQMPVVRTYQIE